MYYHVKTVKKGKIPNNNLHLFNKISKILKNNGGIKYKIIFESDNEQETFEKEISEIKNIGLENLCNLTEGGEGVSGHTWKLSNETKNKISKAHKGKILTTEHKRRLSKAKYKNPSKYWKEKIFRIKIKKF